MTTVTPIDPDKLDRLYEIRDSLHNAVCALKSAQLWASGTSENTGNGMDSIRDALEKAAFAQGYFWAKEDI